MAEPAVQDTAKELYVARASRLNSFGNHSNVNLNDRNLDNHRHARGIAQALAGVYLRMIPFRNLWEELCSYDDLFLAFKKARKHKTAKQYALDLEKNFLMKSPQKRLTE